MRASPFAAALAAALATLAAPAAPARAQDVAGPPGAVTVSGVVAIVSDYRFRGLSRSDRDWAVQGSIRLDHRSGLYLATWASSIDPVAGAGSEIDVFGGWSGNVDGWKPDIGLYSYLYPGGDGLAYFEIYGALTREFGPVSATVGLNHAPDQGNTRRSSTYVYGRAGVGLPGTPVALRAGIGHENGAFARRKLDWTLGATATIGRLNLGLAYVDTDQRFRPGAAGVVLSIGTAF